MRQLYVLRHGIAFPHGSPDFEEDERPLTDKGRSRMKEQARGMKRLGIDPDRILSSPLPRAWQTAEIVARTLGIDDGPERADELRPDRSPGAIRRWLEVLPGESVLIVGHNPSISSLISVLPLGPGTPDVTSLKKGGLASFTVEPEGGYRLDWLATPLLLRGFRGRSG